MMLFLILGAILTLAAQSNNCSTPVSKQPSELDKLEEEFPFLKGL